ncbi:MAG: hypothetical protein MK042_15615 [Cognatishimia sp.]|nr:hypothetical protein [Paracoccaceae bacterium]MCH2251213.1 hypothetical protein [Cognatishimia sp.]
MTVISKIDRADLAPARPLSPEEAVPDHLLRLLAYGDAEAMAEAAGSMQIAEMAGELLAYRLSARAKAGPNPTWGEAFLNTVTGRA